VRPASLSGRRIFVESVLFRWRARRDSNPGLRHQSPCSSPVHGATGAFHSAS
jgi:hypothetical protein